MAVIIMWRLVFLLAVGSFELANSKNAGESETSYADVRCKCICPKEKDNNSTRNVFVAIVEPDQCTCQHIVRREEKFCLRCQCKYEARNTILIKVIIIFILVLLAFLSLYSVYLFVDSRMKPIELSITSDEIQETLTERRRRPRSFSMKAIDQNFVRWKRTVAEQRRHIYGTRSMLS